MYHKQKLNFHKRQFKAYLALRGITKVDVARQMDMDINTFNTKSNHCLKPDGRHCSTKTFKGYFTEDESKKLAKILGMSEKWQRKIFSKVIYKKDKTA